MNNTEINQLIVATALRKMFTGGYFDICTLDKCIELMGFVKGNGGKSYDRLRTLHCISFKDMPAEIAERLPCWIGDCMNGTSIDELLNASRPASERNGSHLLRHLQ